MNNVKLVIKSPWIKKHGELSNQNVSLELNGTPIQGIKDFSISSYEGAMTTEMTMKLIVSDLSIEADGADLNILLSSLDGKKIAIRGGKVETL